MFDFLNKGLSDNPFLKITMIIMKIIVFCISVVFLFLLGLSLFLLAGFIPDLFIEGRFGDGVLVFALVFFVVLWVVDCCYSLWERFSYRLSWWWWSRDKKEKK